MSFFAEKKKMSTPYTFDKGLGVLGLELTWKPPPGGLALRISNGAVQAAHENSY